MKPLPQGCDQQGRYPEAAEAATEIGAEQDRYDRAYCEDVAIAVGLTAFVAFLIFVVGVI